MAGNISFFVGHLAREIVFENTPGKMTPTKKRYPPWTVPSWLVAMGCGTGCHLGTRGSPINAFHGDSRIPDGNVHGDH